MRDDRGSGEPTWRVRLVVTAFALVAVAMWVWAFEQRGGPAGDYRFIVWGVLVLALGLASGAVFEFGLRQRVAVDDIQHVSWRPVVLRALGMASVAAASTLLNFVIAPSWGTARGVTLTLLAIIGGAPAVIALLGIREAVLTTGELEVASRLRAYLELRASGLRLLTALGSLIALTTFALGASRRAAPVDVPALPVEVVVAFGALGTAVVGLVYAVPSHALRHEARALVRELAPLAGGDAGTLRKELDERENVERQLGLTVGMMGDLHAGIAVFGPLVAASIALLLPTK